MSARALLFVGGLFPSDMIDEINRNSIGQIQYAAHELQTSLLDGFEVSFPGEVEILSEPFIGSYPKHYKKWYINGKIFQFGHNIAGKQLPFFNIVGIRDASLLSAYKKGINDWLKQHKSGERVIVFYSIQGCFSLLAKWIKKKDAAVHIHLIVPDLPQFMGIGACKFSLTTLYKSYRNHTFKKNQPYLDTYTLVADAMKDSLGIRADQYVVVEGIANIANSSESRSFENCDDKKTILYTGTLTKKYGVLDLVDAFRMIPDDRYQLLICGAGETKQQIERIAEEDPRVEYLGQLPHDQVVELQRKVTLLVNPRKGGDEFTKYSFPSKLMEYLSSGTQVLCYRLDGIPKEYDAYFNYPDDNSTQALARAMQMLCERHQQDRVDEGKRNQNFIRKKKNPTVQTEKIVKLFLQR